MPPDYATADQLYAVTSRIAEFAAKVDGLADILARTRAPSKAALIGGAPMARDNGSDGRFLSAVSKARSRDAQEQAEGKAVLDGLGVRFVDQADVTGKATVGTSDATGGWIMPNALVADLIKPAEYSNPFRRLMTTVSGVTSSSIDLPWRSAAPSRAVIAGWGTLKENADLVYNGYTATMYTLARIYDIGVQFAKYSAGAAEQDVVTELGHALGLGESHYIVNGTGGTEPYGLVPALLTIPAYTSSFSPAATLAGSITSAIATAAADLLARNRRPEAALISPSAYGVLLTQGSTDGGYYLNGLTGAQAIEGFRPGTLITPFGIPVIPDANIAADDLIVAEFSAFKVYYGDGVRIDTSTEAGSRWDYNLIGYRGELEMGFDARPFVYSGAAQYVADIIP